MVNWGPAADAKLLYCILEAHNIKIDYSKVAQLFGEDVTPKAISHRVTKLRADAKAMVAGRDSKNDDPDAEGNLQVQKTPPNKKRSIAEHGSQEGGKKRKQAKTSSTPTKKGQGTPSQSLPGSANGTPKGGFPAKQDWNDPSEQILREHAEASEPLI